MTVARETIYITQTHISTFSPTATVISMFTTHLTKTICEPCD
jgi:hypothetical protein